ncbi:AraC family transcriptional regulator [Bacillus thuringiensis serovar pingluonsis]|uniref:AraC family transcriptional regulator n=1 Tax=Bacillus thuringiensis serovar pingluonsis TaxID=180881 RepID=A0A243B2H5_BACTU|nr:MULTISPECIES: helix-turn-helix domain-containing protein [Bacillus cereus group]MEB9681761.1 helix-turn-helix domain-containing protein [Bacillus anthracis]OTY36619.1 AraC family transcriptional regulator [Bacillus thuringiensis serovar pingluonsis]
MRDLVNTQYICDLIHKMFSVPIYFLSEEGKILDYATCYDMSSPFYSSKEEHFQTLCQESDLFNFPLFRGNIYLENFLFIRVKNQEGIKGTIIVGPTTYPKVTDEMAIKLMQTLQTSNKMQEGLSYYQSLPEVKKITVLQIGVFLHYMIFKEKLDIDTVWKKNKLLEETPYKIVHPDLYISNRRQDNVGNHNIFFERKFFSQITEGNKENVIKYAYSFPQEDAGITSQGNQLRNQKNNGIMAITLATRYAIEGNLPTDIAFALSDLYIQTIESLDNMYSVNRLIEDALCTFADRVKEYKTKKYSNTITTCLNYISQNIYQKISLSKLAERLHLNPTYLSSLFKKEVGITMSQYIQREKIEEAKKLLTLTSYSLTDICLWLKFTDQSYFIRIFKKITTMTPKQYREKYTII